ncbi:MAG: FMN-binding glutamate synthase family protein [Gammaproteobacteria bacterium]|nr:FMN-binding glutamate synthase family protein [Gammaproteobacteria bacterium]
MIKEEHISLAQSAINLAAGLFIVTVGTVILGIIIIFILDITQTKQALRRNYPVISHFRYTFETLGGFFRQYFFTMDREELPFNRAQRSWVYRAAKNIDTTTAFGSTHDIVSKGSIVFVNCPFPTLGKDATGIKPILIGEGCEHPYLAKSIFNISGMSYGALSRPAVLALSHGAKMCGCWMNTGEGGLSSYHLDGHCDLVFQIGTAKYGVRDKAGNFSDEKLRLIAAHEQVKMFEIKLSQGAKPGKGGILPAAKVTEEIAEIRGIPAGKDSISPNRHEDINCIADLLDMIGHIRKVTGKPVGFKTVIGSYGWLDDLFSEIHVRGLASAPDFITIDSADGGTGAAPVSLMDHMGLSIRESLPIVVNKLIEHRLKDRIRVITSGKLINPTDIAWALCVGADFIVSARGFMFALGCIQAMHCNKNTCPTGITTHVPRLQQGLNPNVKAIRVKHYVENILHEVGVIAHSCGVREPRELTRHHCRIVMGDGKSVFLNELFPVKEPENSQSEK